MKKIMTIVIAVVLCVALLASCAAAPAASSAPASSAAASVAASSVAPSESASAPASASEVSSAKIDAIKKAGKLVMMTNAAFPPYEYLGSDNQVAGVDVQLSQAIADKLGVKLEVTNMEFDSLIPALVAGKGDIVAAGLTITDERKQSVDFSDPYADATQLIIIKEDNTNIKTADDLKGKTIGVQLGTTGDIYVSDIEGATPKQYKTAIDAGLDLANGKLDAVVIDKLPAQNIVSSNKGLKIIDTPLTDEHYAVAVNKGDEGFLALVNGVIKDLISAGTIEKWTEDNAKEAAVASPSPSAS